MKKKLLKQAFLLAVCLLVGTNGMWAAAYTSGSTVAAGSDYFLYNIGAGKFLDYGSDYNTRATVDNSGHALTFTAHDAVNGVYVIYTGLKTDKSIGNGDYLTGAWMDNSSAENYLTFESVTVDGYTNVYKIKNSEGYYMVYNTASDIWHSTGGSGPAVDLLAASGTNNDYWLIIPKSQRQAANDYTFLMKNASFNYTTEAKWSNTDNVTLSGGLNTNQCGEAYNKTFDVYQYLTGVPNGKYNVKMTGYYRNGTSQGTSDDVNSYLYATASSKVTANLPLLITGKNATKLDDTDAACDGGYVPNRMNGASAYIANGNYSQTMVSPIVTDGSLTVGVKCENNVASSWTIFDEFELEYLGTCVVNEAVAFTNGGTMAAGQWYYFDATVAGTYEFTAGSDLTAISYTTDGTQVTSSATGTTLTASQALSVTRYYFKSSSAQTLTVAVPTGAQIVNADIDFSNAITDGAVAGNLNSMALSNTADANKYELGYTSGTPATTVLGDVLRVGNGTGRVTIPDAQLAGNRDEIIISFDMWFGNLSGKNAGFYLYDNDETPAVIGALYCSKYSNTEVINSFGIDRSKITSIGKSGTDNASICVNTNKTTFNIHLDYSTNTMYVEQYTNGTLQQTTTPVSLGSSNPLKTFEVKSDYSGNNPERRCWFDNLHIYTIRGDYSVVPVGYTVKFQDTEGNTLKSDDASRSALAGTAISTLATTADKTTFYNDGDIANNNTEEFAGVTNKYVFKSVSAVTSSSDDTPVDEVAAAGHIITIVYDKYNKYDYTIKQKLGTADATSLQSNSLWQDQTLTYYYPVCVEDGDDYYVTEKKNTTPYFGVVVTKDNANPVINYTQDSRIVYYVESDDMAGSRYKDSQAPSRTSGGKSWCSGASENSYLATNWTLGAGSYDIEVGMANRDYAVTPAPQLKSSTDDDTPVNLEAISLAKSSYAVKNYTSQAIAADEQLYFYNDNGSNASKWALDYVIVRSLPVSESISVTSAGFATYVSSYDLDFTSTDIKAYKVKVSTKGIATMTPVNNVPAGTPVLLYKEGGATEDVPVMTGAAAVTENDLVAGTGAAVATIDGTYTNMILNNVNSKIGFYFANGQTVAANRAYLHIATTLAPDAESNSRMKMVFGDDATAVIDLNDKSEMINDNCYDLQGRRVSQPAKGLYIKNGRKVVVK